MSRSRDLADRINTTFLTPTGNGSQLTGIETESFKPVAVTGTTPSLDVGSYNFFDNGTLTANTTVSFASVPTNARWQYSCTLGVLNGWDISTGVYSRGFSVAAQDTLPTDLFFKPDGLKMYVAGFTGQDINEYDLSTAWDISTAVYLQAFSVATQETQPQAVFFKPDGLKMYVAGSTGDDVNEYDLSTAWDISTAVYLQVFSVAAQEIYPAALFFKPDGLKMYVSGDTGEDINEYDLSTAWDISTAVYLQAFSTATQEIYPRSLSFKPDGLKMYVAGPAGSDINEYTLSTAWDISSAVYLQLFSISAQDTAPGGVFFRPDGSRMYVVGSTNDSVYQYDIGTPTSVTLPASVAGTFVQGVSSEKVTYDFVTSDGGTTVNLINGPATAPYIQPTSYGAVGTYILGRTAFSSSPQARLVAGTTYAGSTLYPAGFSTESGATDGEYASGAGIFAGSSSASALSGTWRAMGTTQHLAGKLENPVTVFVRIA